MNLSEKSKIWKEASATFNQLNSDARGYGNNYVRDYAALERLAPKVRSIFVALEKYIWRLYRLMMSILSLLTTGDRKTYKKYRYDLGVDTRKSMKEKLPEFFSEYQHHLQSQNQFLSYSSARTYYYYKLLCSELRDNISVVEIGAGYGNLAELIMSKHNIKKYVIIDLPEVIQFTKQRLMKLFPELKIIEDIAESNDLPEKHILFIKPSDVHKIDQEQFDLAINTESFAEMDVHVSDGYFELLSWILKSGAKFLSINRICRVIGENPQELSSISSPFLNNTKSLSIISIEVDKYRALFPCFYDAPNLAIFYSKK